MDLIHPWVYIVKGPPYKEVFQALNRMCGTQNPLTQHFREGCGEKGRKGRKEGRIQ